ATAYARRLNPVAAVTDQSNILGLPNERRLQLGKARAQPCDSSVTLSWPPKYLKEGPKSAPWWSSQPLRNGAVTALVRSVHVGHDLEIGLGLSPDFVERDAGGKLRERHSAAAFLVDGEDAEVGDHHVDDPGAGERERAALEQFLLLLGGVFHDDDHL